MNEPPNDTASPTSAEKGNALENAVRGIESAILHSVPGLSEGTFRIEGKKIVTIGGVRHEIDLFVKVSLATGYEAIFVFECKNWQQKVGKNDVIIFSEKIKAVGAQKGFFVAKSFTRDARAQAATDPRIEILDAVQLDPAAVIVPANFHGIQVGATNVACSLLGFNRRGVSRPIDFSSVSFSLSGTVEVLHDYVQKWAEALRDSRVNHFPSAVAEEGTHSLEFSDARTFSQGVALLNGKPVQEIQLKGSVDVEVKKAVVISAFEIKTRGRLITVQVESGPLKISAEFVELPTKSPEPGSGPP